MVLRKKKTKNKVEYGDFQTPPSLAREVCELLASSGVNPTSILEPTCGTGALLIAALDQFPQVREAIGLEVNPDHVTAARSAAQSRSCTKSVRIIHDDFFGFEWGALLQDLAEPLLVIGNPPWVTNAELGSLASSNLPQKTNFQNHSGLDALTGKSNFDISEWMLIRMLELLRRRRACLAMLCKTAVARKVLLHAWKNRIGLESSDFYRIDAARHFGASVDACLLVCRLSAEGHSDECSVHEKIASHEDAHRIGYRDGQLVADIALYDRWKNLQGDGVYTWRSGVKHDCAKVMELHKVGSRYRNGLGELIEVEDEYLFPMLKGSDVATASPTKAQRWMLVTQTTVGDETNSIKHWAPKTWDYLVAHAEALDRRASSIYRKRPRFSVFGVGPYSFAKWKVCVSGLYKRLHFKVVGSVVRKPVMLDDTAYFLPCETEQEAEYIASLLNSRIATEFLCAFIFWDAKRPITVQLLRRLDLLALARELGSQDIMNEYVSRSSKPRVEDPCLVGAQGRLFPDIAPEVDRARTAQTRRKEEY